MPRYEGPDSFDDGYNLEGGDFFDPESVSAEDIFEQIEANLSPEKVSYKEIIRMAEFLQRFMVLGADQISEQELEVLWRNLEKNHTLIKDLTYMAIDVKTRLHFSKYPVMPTLQELIEYSEKLYSFNQATKNGEDKESLRIWTVETQTVPSIEKFRFNKEGIKLTALGEINGRALEADAIRFLGWLTSQSFMVGAPERFQEYLADNGIDEADAKITHLATMCTLEVIDALEWLKNQKKWYRDSYSMEIDALPNYEATISAMTGILNICQDVLLGRPDEE